MGKVHHEVAQMRKRTANRPHSSPQPGVTSLDDSSSRWKTGLTVLVMLLAVIAVYFPVSDAPGQNALWGADFYQLHLFRIRFAQAGLFGPNSHLPSWYPRELLGTPFWSNIQSFPFLPTRLVLLGLDPLTIFPVAVILAAVLAALFTFLYARRLELSRPAAAAAGWTFAAAGFFASRVMAGHLPLLEAYPALPLLLWLTERFREVSGRRTSLRLLALGLACACIALAGHPQLPLYSGLAATLYALVRLRGKARWQALGAMAAGAGCAAFVLWPMLLLIERSTRVLALDPASTDISFPYSRLIAFFLPWHQGWPDAVLRTPWTPVTFPNDAYFWDTVCYVGWLPLLASGFLLVRLIVRRKLPKWPWGFIALLSIGGLILALPFARLHHPGTILRSPARLLYFTAFGLSLALGVALDGMLNWNWPGKRLLILGVAIILIAFHLFDLSRHDRYFIRMLAYHTGLSPMDERLAKAVGEGRIAIDSDLPTPLNRELDDIGMFDSIALAKPYEAILDLSDLPPKTNTQYIDGSDLDLRALSTCGVHFVVTNKTPGGGPPSFSQSIHVYPIRDPAQRVQFYPDDSVQWLDVATTHANLRNPRFDLRHWLMLPGARQPAEAREAQTQLPHPPAEIRYVRESEDQVSTDVKTVVPGYLFWLDAWDPGWHATLDGAPVSVLPAQDVFMAVHIPPGLHTVRLAFSTPGAWTGAALSVICLVVLGLICCLPLLERPAAP